MQTFEQEEQSILIIKNGNHIAKIHNKSTHKTYTTTHFSRKGLITLHQPSIENSKAKNFNQPTIKQRAQTRSNINSKDYPVKLRSTIKLNKGGYPQNVILLCTSMIYIA